MKINLTAEQRAAYDKLVEGVRAIANLDAPDTETLLAWLHTSGPVVEPVLEEASLAAIESIQHADGREWIEPRNLWEEWIEDRILHAAV